MPSRVAPVSTWRLDRSIGRGLFHYGMRSYVGTLSWNANGRLDQFILSQPWHVLRAGAAPYWTVFPVQRCADAAAAWINSNGPFPRIDVALFNHGIASTGLAGAGRWQALAHAGERPGTLLGQRPGRFPADFAALTRAATALRRLPDGPPWPRLPIDLLADV